jgi:hypothetical protein
MEVVMKTCAKCKIEKDESEFHKNKNKKDGRCPQCKPCALARGAAYHQNNPEKSRETSKRYRRRNKDRTAAYYRKRRKEDVIFSVKGRVSRRINDILKDAFGVRKSRVTNKILCCTGTELLAHLGISSIEELEGNHVDHVCPLSCALTEEEVYKLNHYSNLRIIPAAENLAKSDHWSSEGAMLHLRA